MQTTGVLSWKSLYSPRYSIEEFKIEEREAAANEVYKRKEEGTSKTEKICQDKEGNPEEAFFRACLPAMPSRTWGSRKIRGISPEGQSQRALFLSYCFGGFSETKGPLKYVFKEKFNSSPFPIRQNDYSQILSSKLLQRGQSNRGFHGFLPEDIRKEAARASRKICFVCKRKGAAINCQKDQCVRNFHLPCGLERGCLSQFFGEYKSFCGEHRPTQNIRRRNVGEETCILCCEDLSQISVENIQSPCCSQTVYHRKCIQKYAHTSAKYFFKCPQCNNREEFPQEMLRMGIHIPDRDAAWELEPGAFSELYQRYQHCDAPICLYEQGRDSSEEEGKWRIILCATCGSHGTHRNCSSLRSNCKKWECTECAPAARAIEYTLGTSGGTPCCSSTFLSRGHFYRDARLEESPGPSWASWPGSSLLENPESSGPRRSHSWESKGVTISKSCKKSE